MCEQQGCVSCTFDCVYFVPADYDSTTAFTRNFLAPRSFDRSCVANFFRRREFFFVAAKIFSSARKFGKKKFGPTRSILSKNRGNRSHPRDFWAIWKLKNHWPLLGEFSRSSRDSLHYTPHSGTNLGTIGRIRQKVAYEVLNFRYFLLVFRWLQ